MSTRLTKLVRKATSNNLNRQVAQYSLAAAVAGVSMLALAAPAAGEVVVTKKTIHIPMSPWQSPETVNVSLANNGVNDIKFNLYSDTAIDSRFLLVGGARSQDGVIASYNFTTYASVLGRGAKIGPSAFFFSYSTRPLIEGSRTSEGSKHLRGKWGGNSPNRYLGVRFQLNGQAHYGWIRLTVTTDPKLKGALLSATITGYAYETTPNKPILAGTAGTAAAAREKPSAEVQLPESIQNQSGPSLGMLAAGADALPIWRREETSVRQ